MQPAMTNTPLSASPYSLAIKILAVFGAWTIESQNETLITFYVVYKLFISTFAIAAACLMFEDLYFVFGDLRKMTWNLSLSVLFFLSLVKNIISNHNCRAINKLRNELHKDEQSFNSAEDTVVNASALKELQLMRFFFYGAASLFLFVWATSKYFSYLWAPREIPTPMQIPISYDLDDDTQYNFIYGVFTVLVTIAYIFILESEILVFGIFIQISREYSRLLMEIPKINELFKQGKSVKPEVNPSLRRMKLKILIRDIIVRQQKLMQYTKSFEDSYNKIFIIQISSLVFSITISSIQLFIVYSSLSIQMTYQLGYTFIMVIDLYMICYYASRIHDQCLKVGEEMYFTVWYCTDADFQKLIRMIIMRAQRPLKITCGKLTKITLHTFMDVLKTIYSLLALYKKIEKKYSPSY